MRTRSQRLSFDRGRLSIISTVSPTCDSFFSSCMWQTVFARRILPYFGCLYNRGISTRRVLSILSLVTRPIARLRIVSCPWSVVRCCFSPNYLNDPVLLRSGAFQFPFALDRADASDFAAEFAEVARRIELFGRRLKP